MFDFIQKLQQKPEHIRKQIAFFLAGIVALIIATIWIITFDSKKISSTDNVSVIEMNQAPFTLFKEQFASIKNIFSK